MYIGLFRNKQFRFTNNALYDLLTVTMQQKDIDNEWRLHVNEHNNVNRIIRCCGIISLDTVACLNNWAVLGNSFLIWFHRQFAIRFALILPPSTCFLIAWLFCRYDSFSLSSKFGTCVLDTRSIICLFSN